MKAILVMDIDDKYVGKEKSLIKFTDNNVIYCSEKLKPMPERANEEEYRRDYYEFEERSEAIEMIKYVRRKGYNQCIDEILGDQK